MADSPTIVAAALDDKQLKDSISNLVGHMKRALNTMTKDTDDAVSRMQKSLEKLGSLKIDSGGSADGGASKRAKAQNSETDAVKESAQAYKEKTMTLDQQASAINTAIQSEKKYTDEILKQAAAIRATKEWQEKGSLIVGDVVYYDKERSNVSKRNKQFLLSLEEQIVQAQQNEAEAARRASQETRNQAQAQQQVQQSALGTAKIIESVYEMQRRSLGLSSRDASVPTFTLELESAKRLSDRLKELREQYNNMNFGQRDSSEGQAVAQQIREITRQGQILNNQLNIPTKKEIFGLSEKTLDDIAYKVRQLNAYKQGLNLKTQGGEIKQVDDAIKRLNNDLNKYMSTSRQVNEINKALGRSWNYMKNRLAFYFTVGASTQFVKNLIEVRSQYEMNERALGILINSAERGTQIFNELSQLSLVSPYTLIELSSAAKQLTAYDIAAKDVVDTTRRLADMASAVGIPIERLTYALGQIKAYGYLNARDARMFANAGIPLVKNLSEYYTELEGRLVSTADIYDRIKNKQIGYEEVMSTISKMTDEGGKFYDFQAKMAETLKVQLANLTLAWNNMLNAMGEESQGVLVAGIGTLKQVFLHWKDIEHVLDELVVALGAYKAYQIITTRLMGATAASLDAQVLAMKRNKAAMLEKQALTRKLTPDELRQVAAQNQVTAADYRNALSGKQLTKQKALLLVALNKNNVQLKSAVVNMGLLTTQEVANITAGKALAIVFKSIGISIRSAALAAKAFMASMWPLLVVGAIYELYHAWDSYGEHVKEVNKQAAEHAKEAFESIKQYLESESTINTRQRVVYKEGNPLTDAESQKAWDEMREKIELSSSASNTFVARLMQIDDINHRLAAGFDYLRNVQRVAGVMQTLKEDAVNVSSTTLGGLFGEGLKDDLTDFINDYQKYVSLNENLRQSYVGEEYFNDQKRALEEFRGEVEKTTTSLYNIASKEGFNTNEQREFFEREISEIAQAEQMGAKETRIFRMQAEKEYYAYARAQLVAQLEYQQGAQKAATEARIKDLDNEFGTNKALQESFFIWLTEKQDHAVKNMLRGKTQEEIKQGEWLKGSNAKWVEEMARKFSKEYGVSFNDLHRLVLNANTWSINIPVFFQTIGQPLSDVQRDYEARTGKKFKDNPIIKDAKSQVEILDILKKKQKEVANEMATAEKAGGKYWEDNKQRYKEENDALVADIHAYNALTDAEEKANKKNNKGSKKDPLLDALKQEISLVEKLQNDYDKLSKSGASQSDALDTIRGAYGKTIRLLNAQLGGYGLPQIDISQLITGKDPNKALAHFKQTLDTLVRKGMLTLERSKELEAVVEKFTLSAKTYNLDMITKGLNNELGKLNDEYELAVALDASPELGNVFMSAMGLSEDDLRKLPRTWNDVANKAQQAINRVFYENKVDKSFDLLANLDKGSLEKWAKENGQDMDDALMKELVKFVEKVNKVRLDETKKTTKEWDDLIDKYGGLQHKLIKITKDSVQEQIKVIKQSKDGNAIKEALNLSDKISMSQDPSEIARLQNELAVIFNKVITDNPDLFKVGLGVENQELSLISKAYWEDFKNSELYSEVFEDMSRKGVQSIKIIIAALEALKDKVKDDPESMKALIKSLEDATKELESRNPLKTIGDGFKDMKEGIRIVKFNRPLLKNARKELDAAKKSGDQERINKAQEDYNNALDKSRRGWDLIRKGQEKVVAGLEGMKNQVSMLGEAFTSVANLFGEFGDEETKQAIEDINKGFTIMVSTITAVIAVMELLKTSNVWLLAVAAALGVIIGLVNFISKRDNQRIDKKIEQSKYRVKQLEKAYKNLQHAVDEAYGTAVIGAQQMAIANKKLQLVELKRQLQLEKSRSQKNYDKERVLELEGQIIDLENEINDAINDIVENLLGVSSVGDAVGNLVDSIVDALRNGEDAMESFNESVDDMIVNLLKKFIQTRYIGPLVEEAFNKMNDYVNSKSQDLYDEVASLEQERQKYVQGNERAERIIRENPFMREQQEKIIADNNKQIANLDEQIAAMKKLIQGGGDMTESDLDVLVGILEDLKVQASPYYDVIKELLERYGMIKDGNKELSALQQGIQSITEDTAGAIEAYLNGISQQVYLHSDLLTQIRDAVVSFDFDTNLGVMSQILLQLQSSYQVQMSIQGILEGVLNPSGQAFKVEMV